MKPASTEQRRRRKQSRRPAAVSESRASRLVAWLQRRSAWEWTGAGILSAAAVLRALDLTLKPLHHDEGVNGLFLTNLFRGGYYHYDPSNFHGPTVYYFGWITTTINSLFYGKEGLSTFALRATTVVFGLGVLWLLLCLRKEIGSFGAMFAAILAAVSPGMVFFSRYFIHEILFVFFTLGIVIAFLRWRGTFQPRYLMLAVASAALLGATKETWLITVAVWLIAIPCTRAWMLLARKLKTWQRGAEAVQPQSKPVPQDPPLTQVKNSWTRGQLYAVAAPVFAMIWVLFYSSFFTNFPQGVIDSIRTFGYWLKTSKSAHEYGVFKYVWWLWQMEAPTLILGTTGIAVAFWQARSRFAVFTGFWSLGIVAAYSLVGYKTPWCALNIILPFVIMAGYGLQRLYDMGLPRFSKIAVPGTLATIAATFSLYQAIELNFFHYDDEVRPYIYVYAHTQRDFLALVNEIESIAAGNPQGKDIGIVVMSPEHWPLPWYLRDYPNTGYWGKVIETSEPILVVHESQVLEVDRTLGAKYRRISAHDLRPGNRLFLYLRRDPQP